MRKIGKITRFNIDGELSIFSAAALQQRLLDAISTGKEIEVDLSQVSEMDTAGIQLMVAAKREAADQKKLLRFAGHSQAVLDLIELFDLSEYFGDPLSIHTPT